MKFRIVNHKELLIESNSIDRFGQCDNHDTEFRSIFSS